MIKRKGFTLVEMSIVLVIIGILMAITTKGKSLINTAKLRKDVSKVYNMGAGVELYMMHSKGKLPASDTGSYCTFDYTDEFFDYITPDNYESDRYEGLKFAIAKGGHTTDGYFNPVCIDGMKYLILTSKDPGGTLSKEFRKQFACYLEVMLDDSNLKAGLGRKVGNAESTDLKPGDFDNCLGVPEESFMQYSFLLWQ